MKAVMPFEPASGSVFAYTTNVSAIGPLVILDILGSETCILPNSLWKHSPEFVAVKDISVTVLDGLQRHADNVAPTSRFAHSESTNFVS